MVPFTKYSITVKDGRNNRLAAKLEINGIQQFEVYECSVKITDDKAEFFFERAGDAKSGANSLSSFKKGELMFALIKTKVGKQFEYLFEPSAFKIKRLSASKQTIVFDKR